MPQQWTTEEDIAVLALTKKYGSSGWQDDPLTTTLISTRGIKRGSLGMAIRNFLALMKLPGGLKNWSQRQYDSFQKHGKRDAGELRELANRELGGP